jgi:heme-degrading monooxygenase HmoA
MVIVLIRRCVKREKEAEFLANFNREKPNHPDFIDETLTKVSEATDLPEPLRNLPIAGDDCVTYLNVARWKSAAAFNEHFKPRKMHDPETEVSDRLRAVLEIVEPN